MGYELNIEIRDLRYFETIAELGHLGKAADVLCRSQPALTKCIHRLESEIGAALFERKGRGLELTAVGREFYIRASKICEASDRYLSDMKEFIAGSVGKVRVGCGPITADYLLPIICNLVLRHAPQVSLEIMINTNYFLKEQIKLDRLDLIVGVVTDDDEFRHQAFIDDTVVVAARRDHPIFRSGRVKLPNLLDYQWILPTTFVGSRRWLDNVFLAHKLERPSAHIETNSLPSIHDVIGSTDLLCFLSRLTLEHPKTRGMLKEVKLKETTMVRKLGLTYPHGSLTPATAKLIELLNQHHGAHTATVVDGAYPVDIVGADMREPARGSSTNP
ncbi:LysR family transcriptional regulator [Paralcaligenes sp. KSB-10]|uniref:LysR family transcriptional regulator n=1 Tax=Paralcaligenes sp. KSB-10 TaxID=2901142 RepID=UPI001E400117|nr:LysR family transcriptional regulator [Paralcaligenes sp. KSB-10]UHL63749.1 LysR family transcriptional regulator [Paralcaligenes sp. KSB-10]